MWTKANAKQRATILSALGIRLSSKQLDVVRDSHRIRLVAGGERGGKSFVSSVDLVTRLPWGREFWLIGPDYYLPRAEFEYIESFLGKLGAIRGKRFVSKPKEGSWRLETKSGQVIITRTSADVRKLAARPIDGIVLCEAGQQSYDVLLKSIGRVSETRGWILASGTFESSFDWYANTFREWQETPETSEGRAYSLPTWENLFKFPGGREDPEILRMERLYEGIPGYFMEKCGAVPAPPLGVIFREFSHRVHISEEASFDARLPVYLGIDPAHGGPSAYAIVACQFVASRNPRPGDLIDVCHVIDILYVPAGDFDIVSPLVASREWFPMVIGGAIDVEAPDERKRWRRYLGVNLIAKKVRILEGERRLHTFLRRTPGEMSQGLPPSVASSHLLFAPTVAEVALREFSLYRSPLQSPEEIEGKPPTTAKSRRGPEHMLKALWYLLYARYGPVRAIRKSAPHVRGAWSRLREALGK